MRGLKRVLVLLLVGVMLIGTSASAEEQIPFADDGYLIIQGNQVEIFDPGTYIVELISAVEVEYFLGTEGVVLDNLEPGYYTIRIFTDESGLNGGHPMIVQDFLVTSDPVGPESVDDYLPNGSFLLDHWFESSSVDSVFVENPGLLELINDIPLYSASSTPLGEFNTRFPSYQIQDDMRGILLSKVGIILQTMNMYMSATPGDETEITYLIVSILEDYFALRGLEHTVDYSGGGSAALTLNGFENKYGSFALEEYWYDTVNVNTGFARVTHDYYNRASGLELKVMAENYTLDFEGVVSQDFGENKQNLTWEFVGCTGTASSNYTDEDVNDFYDLLTRNGTVKHEFAGEAYYSGEGVNVFITDYIKSEVFK